MTSPTPDASPKKTIKGGKTDAPEKDAIELLKADHREVETLFGQFAETKGRSQRRKLIEKIAAALTAHTLIEEEIFYPACREKGVEDHDLDEAQVEHDTLKVLIADLLRGTQDQDYYEAKVTVLSEYVKHHVGEEESPSDGLFARAKSAGLDMGALGKKLQTRKDELMADEPQLLARPPQIRSLTLSQSHQEYNDMARYPNDRHRDDEGRYGGDRSPGREYQDYDNERHGSSLQRGSRAEFYRGDYDEDFGPNRGTWGESYYDRSPEGYRDDRYAGARRDFYGENARSGSGRPGTRRIEQSASGGRYRLDYDQDDNHDDHPGGGGRHLDHNGVGRHLDHNGVGRHLDHNGGGRHLDHNGGGRHLDHPGTGRYSGSGGEDREYYQGTRYGTSYGGGRYPNQGEDDRPFDQGERYYSGQGHGPTRGGAYGGQSAYGSGSDYENGDSEGRGASIERGRPGSGTGDYRRRSGGGSGQSQYGRGRYEGSGPGYRGNR